MLAAACRPEAGTGDSLHHERAGAWHGLLTRLAYSGRLRSASMPMCSRALYAPLPVMRCLLAALSKLLLRPRLVPAPAAKQRVFSSLPGY